MNVVDVNVLIALFRTDHAKHDAARAWWSEFVASGEEVVAPDLVWVGFLRIVTNARIFSEPEDFAEAWAFVEALMSNDSYAETVKAPGQMAALADICLDANCTGDLVTNAYIAAFARVLGATVVTFDRDFRLFRAVKVLELV